MSETLTFDVVKQAAAGHAAVDGGEIVDCVPYALRPLERAGNY